MPHVYLAPYVGVGSDEDPYRPRGSEQSRWSAIDLRPNSTILAGRALVAVPVRDDTIGIYLGDAPDEVSAAIKTAVESRFGLTLTATRLRHIIPELLIAHAREDSTRWRPLRAMRDGMFRVYLGGLWWEAKSLSGGSTITESFNTTDSTTLGPDLTWTELSGDWTVAGNQAVCVGSGTSLARADSDLATADHYAQAVMTALTYSQTVGIGVICRKDSTTTVTHYLFWAAIDSSTNGHSGYKALSGTFTQLGSTDTTDFVANEVMRVEANGSTITFKINGVTSVGPVTDTAITGNLRTGIRGYFQVALAGTITLDNFRAGDLADLPIFSHSYRQRRMSTCF